ncbi:unnamed protein product [Phyllotreta striolata]|uniref:Peptidase S1 domain-containing protein n=1 Tax=Phyllotreta striolata TaxID=444603 RepID=A0A9P0GTL8_PHYSR|nr:unnamed protein product [Phyllotreta striolata]
MFPVKSVIFLALAALCSGAPNHHQVSSGKYGITGGTPAQPGQFPYQVSVQYCLLGLCEHICGGAIINETWILTGAQCAGSATNVLAGLTNLHDNKTELKVKFKLPHEGFPTTGLGPNDIGLIQLEEPIQFNEDIQPVKLPKQGEQFNGTAVFSGYGDIALPDFNKLTYIDGLQLVDFKECERALESVIKATSPLDETSNLCTLNTESSSCNGDGGGPLVQNGTVIGLGTWFVQPCGAQGAPNVFTQVASFVDWINDNMKD